MEYPFTPKSTSYLEQGQYWPIPLNNGKYACGVVLAKLEENGKTETRSFYAGLLDWCDSIPPHPDAISNAKVLKKGALHVKAISKAGSQIEGRALLNFLPSSPVAYTDDIITMGYSVPSVLAEKYFAG
jgi:hypothetical protein